MRLVLVGWLVSDTNKFNYIDIGVRWERVDHDQVVEDPYQHNNIRHDLPLCPLFSSPPTSIPSSSL